MATRYYVLENRIQQDANGENRITKEPTFMKKYSYYKVAFDADAGHTLVQTWEPVAEAQELTLLEAQAWVDTNSPTKLDVKAQDTLEIFCEAKRLHDMYGVK